MKRAALISLLFAFATPATAAVPGIPSMDVMYAGDCTFTLAVDPNTVITSASAPGQTLPPGTYDLTTYMPNPSSGYSCGKPPTFTLTGPGVSVQLVFQGQELSDERLITLPPSSTYVAQDANAPAATQRVFSTSATGSSTSLVTAPKSTATGKGSTQPDIVGSGIAPYRGKLVASVANDVTRLKLGGRSVVTVRAGKYEIVDPHATVFVRHANGKRVQIKSGARITLTAGRWVLYARAAKPAHLTVSA
jgi:hypothetical protein